jgi:predicted Zn finger-like uncharacterized protein
MGKKRPERTARRVKERQARELVRDLEKLAVMSPGGSRERPMEVDSAAVVEPRVASLACPLCNGAYRLLDHRSVASGVREVDVRCTTCSTPRTLWFRLVSSEPN